MQEPPTGKFSSHPPKPVGPHQDALLHLGEDAALGPGVQSQGTIEEDPGRTGAPKGQWRPRPTPTAAAAPTHTPDPHAPGGWPLTCYRRPSRSESPHSRSGTRPPASLGSSVPSFLWRPLNKQFNQYSQLVTKGRVRDFLHQKYIRRHFFKIYSIKLKSIENFKHKVKEYNEPNTQL